MLVKPADLFTKAMNMGYAIGAFNASNLELTQAIIWAAEEKKSPIIVQTSESAVKYSSAKTISAIISTLAEQASVPVVMHLDHGKSFEIVKQCIEVGYSSVMIDLSKEDFEDNIRKTREVVDYSHARGIWVEAELGAILGQEGAVELDGKKTPEEMLTNPKQAKRFVEETGVDALAVSVGTIHGAFSGQEYLRFEVIEELEKVIPETPLVLHGASGLADEHIVKAATTHVCKVNVDTEMRIAFEAAIKAYFNEEHDKLDPRKIIEPAREAVQAVVAGKIKILGSANKA